ncbi:MAG TPA: complex I NDUFA9 subunit family protein [Methylophilaceae bacterium]|nr:complex I NDUFA9 subunit family protein [Methylophilaceae bacterium]
MMINKVAVIGGSGFVGSSIVNKLNDEGYQVKVLTRNRERAKHLILLPQVEVETCDVSDSMALKSAITGCDAVINLVGILHEGKNSTFDKVHHQLPKCIAEICHELGVKRFLHMSALRASTEAPSQYLQSKARGEIALNAFNESLNVTIFKPSIIFGRDDSFLNLFATMTKYLPVIFLAKPESKFQPIWVEDVASIFVNSLQNDGTYHKTYELGGPSVYSLQALVEKVMHLLNKKKPIIGLSDRLSYLQAWFLEWLPVKLMTRDNVRSMEVDSVTSSSMPSEIAYSLTPLEAIMPSYILNKTPRAKYHQYRTAAGRTINARR